MLIPLHRKAPRVVNSLIADQLVSLERIRPELVLDDYFVWSGARDAAAPFLARHGAAGRTLCKERVHRVRS